MVRSKISSALLPSLTAGALIAVVLFVASPVFAGGARVFPQAPPPAEPGVSHVPVFAYYYIWFTTGSWDRAKTDLPNLGRYSSSDPSIIAEHIRLARQAGIDGFIVSWKHEPRLDVPLERLVNEARRQNFKLILLYQGLDFDRNPIDPKRVLDDLSWFTGKYAGNPVFDVFGRPAVIWSGTWKFTDNAIGMVRAGLGAPDPLMLLGSERSAADYSRRAAMFDGDAYYWSSGDSKQTPGYEQRIDDLAHAVLTDGGRWIAPAAPGFDARLIGGTSTIDRRDGETYRAAWKVAADSHPSAMGIISWNEFSENSHIEPSVSYGSLYLDVTRELTGGGSAELSPPPSVEVTPTPGLVAGPIDSSEVPRDEWAPQLLLSFVTGLGLLLALGAIVYRVRRRPA